MTTPDHGVADAPADLAEEVVLEVLTHGELDVQGRLVDASNVALFAVASLDDVQLPCIYKPVAGERRLWDFPDGTLAGREVATWRLASALGWPVVPPTVWREDGPAGEGMCQRWIEVDEDQALVDVVQRGRVPRGWRAVVEAYGPGGEPVTLVHGDTPDLRRLTLLDAVANNADRKGGHVLVDAGGVVAGIDHGVTFNAEDKLRTVLWGWSGEPIDADLLDGLSNLQDRWRELDVAHLISPSEVRAARRRLDRLVAVGVFPEPGDGWPSLPWPAF